MAEHIKILMYIYIRYKFNFYTQSYQLSFELAVEFSLWEGFGIFFMTAAILMSWEVTTVPPCV